MSTSPSTSSAQAQFLERLRAATETLELVAADRSALALLPETEHRRLRDAAAVVFNPDARARRTMSKALARRRQAERADRDDEVGCRSCDCCRRRCSRSPISFPRAGWTMTSSR
jgi:hypothetical protein